jgi:fructokinase
MRPGMTIVSVGEILWDVIGEDEHLGGAPFNFAVNVSRLGHEVLFVSGVGDDARGRRAVDQAQALGLSTDYIKTVEGFPTGLATVELDADGQPSFQVQRPAAYDRVALTEQDVREIAARQPDWIYFGTLCQLSSQARRLTEQLIGSAPQARRFYDVNLRPDSYTPALVEALCTDATVLKLSESEADTLAGWFDLPIDSIEDFCRRATDRFGWQAVVVTRGADGCTLLMGDEFCESPGVRIQVADAVGAGDAFSAAFLHGLSAGWPARQVAEFANRVGALVASRRGATPVWTLDDIQPAATE